MITSLGSFLKDLFFCNDLSLIFKAYKHKSISLHQLLTNPSSHQAQHQSSKRFIEYLKSISTSKLKFIRLMIKQQWRLWILVGILSIISITFTGIQPYLSSLIISLVKDTTTNSSVIIKIIFLLFLSKVIKSLISIHLYFQQYSIGLKLYINLSLAIYQKSQQLSQQQRFTSNERGRSLTLLEQDCNKLITFPYFFCQIIITGIQIVYGLTYLTIQLPKCNFSIGYYIMLVYFVISVLFSFIITSFSQTMLSLKDHRLSLTILSLQTNQPFNHHSLLSSRSNQLHTLTSIFNTQILFRSAPIFFSAFFLSVTLVWNYNEMDVQELYVVILLFNQICYPIQALPFVVQNFTQLGVNLGRVLKFVNVKQEYEQGQGNKDVSKQSDKIFKNKQQQSRQLIEFKKVGQVSWQAIRFYATRGGFPLLFTFIFTRLIVQLCNAASSLLNKSLSHHTPIPHPLIQFFSPFLSFLPFLFSFYLITRFSLNVSKNIYPQISLTSQNSNKSLLMNLLSNDLRVVDRVIGINVFDFFSSILSIIRNISLILYTISLNNSTYVLYMIPLIVIMVSILVFINRGFMWIRRQCTRLQSISKTPFLHQFYHSLSSPSLSHFSKLHTLLSRTTQISLRGMYFESWYQLILISFSLVMLIIIVSIASIIIKDEAMLGFVFTQVLVLDSVVRDFFVSMVTIERNSIAVERIYGILGKRTDKKEQISIDKQQLVNQTQYLVQ